MEFLSTSFLYNFVKDVLRFIFKRGRRLTAEEKIALRQKWRPQFEEEIIKNWRDKLRRDAIIRDVRRVDNYPDTDDSHRGISPWFRVGLIDVYHKGILVAFQWDRLIQDADGTWREKSYETDEQEGEKVVLAGKIPFENIEAVDFDGDEYYYFPHIYCHFSIKKSPYESVDYFQEFQNPGGRPHYSHFASVKDVKRRFQPKRWWQFWK
ncbi:hypothetical protein [Sulfitobacter sp. 1A16808]|uniref:hypothetical protein n=1 Tax=Sulfitobacter sp. 1A16808 TaxID=3368572 RepID=UPI0037459833